MILLINLLSLNSGETIAEINKNMSEVTQTILVSEEEEEVEKKRI